MASLPRGARLLLLISFSYTPEFNPLHQTTPPTVPLPQPALLSAVEKAPSGCIGLPKAHWASSPIDQMMKR